MRARATATKPDAGAVLTKAALAAAARLGLPAGRFAAVIGVSPASVSRMNASARGIDPGTKEGELALAFLRMYRSLGALLGDAESCRAWFHSENVHLGGVPAELVQRIEGLVHVTGYLDAMRGKV